MRVILQPAAPGMHDSKESGQLSAHLFFNSKPGFMMLAVWAMPVAAGSVHYVKLIACVTFIDRRSIMRGSAINDGVDRFEVSIGHGGAKAPEILRPITIEDVFNCCHAHLLSSGH